MTSGCNIYGCLEDREPESLYCETHTAQMARLVPKPETVESIYDHVKVNIEQTAKGARVTVTYDRSDHDIDRAVEFAQVGGVRDF